MFCFDEGRMRKKMSREGFCRTKDIRIFYACYNRVCVSFRLPIPTLHVLFIILKCLDSFTNLQWYEENDQLFRHCSRMLNCRKKIQYFARF
jgi:hypothetical protein